MNHSIRNSVIALSVAGGVGCVASVQAEPSGYIGGAYGWEKLQDSDFEDDVNSKKLYFGGKFNSYIGIEASVNDYGEAENDIYKAELDGKTLALMGYMPLTDSFELFIKGGMLWWDADIEVLDVLEDEFDGEEPFFGAGMQFNFSKALSMRVEYERYDVDLTEDEVGIDVRGETNADVASVGLQFNF